MTNILHLANSCHACPNFSGCPIRTNSTTTGIIEKSKRIYDYRVDDIIINEGERSPIIGIVVEGALRTTVTQSDGRQQVLGIHLQYSLFSHPFEKGSRYGVEAATNVRVCTFDRPSLERLILAQPELQHAILLATLDDLGAAKALVSILGSLRAPERIARFFLHLANRSDGKDQDVRIPVSRRDLAALLGTTPETISRFVQEMVRNRVLQVKSARTLAILDRPKLDMVAGAAIQDIPTPARRSALSPTGLALSTKPVDIVKRLRNRQFRGVAANPYPGPDSNPISRTAAKTTDHSFFSQSSDIDGHQ